MTWDWSKFAGDPACLKWSRRDLANLEAVLPLVSGRAAVVQAGGNVGIFPKRLAELFETVYTFEPSPALFAALVQNVPEPNVVKLEAAVGYDRVPIRLERKRRDGSRKPVHDGLTHVAGPGVIPTLRIDDLGLRVCNLIYLDVEGFELFALKGAIETIAHGRPVIVVEINRSIDYYGQSPDELRHWIYAQSYSKALKVNSDEAFLPL